MFATITEECWYECGLTVCRMELQRTPNGRALLTLTERADNPGDTIIEAAPRIIEKAMHEYGLSRNGLSVVLHYDNGSCEGHDCAEIWIAVDYRWGFWEAFSPRYKPITASQYLDLIDDMDNAKPRRVTKKPRRQRKGHQ